MAARLHQTRQGAALIAAHSGRSLTVAVRIVLLLLFTTVAHAEESPRIRHIFVPVDKPELWPKEGDRQPVPFE